MSLQNFYTGVERIFEEIAKQVDESIPAGGSSHRELLEQMALEIAEVRPPVIQPDTLEALNEYRGFRHVVVHLYGFELYLDRIRQLIRGLPTCCDALIRYVNAFCEFLSKLGQSLQG